MPFQSPGALGREAHCDPDLERYECPIAYSTYSSSQATQEGTHGKDSIR